MKKIKLISILLILMILFISKISFAKGEIQIISDKSILEIGEEANISINIENTEIAAISLEIYWDKSKLEYINGPENSNNLNNRVLYTWISNDGKNTDKLDIESFKFKALEEGITSIAVTGEFYNSDGNKININTNNLEIKIGRDNEEIEKEVNQDERINVDNVELEIMRLNYEGITPDFNKDIKEYYFVTDKDIQNLEITAIPRNADASVKITGNKNLKMGENTIIINVTAKDKSRSSEYKIYFTKTKNLEEANANLETLAIRETTLNPEFDSNITQYKADIANNIDKIDILAIPQKQNVKLSIAGNEQMQIGDNKITINVIAENGTTHKKYQIIVHRRDEQEEQEAQEEIKNQAERVSAILKDEENNNNENKDERNIHKIIIPIIIGICAIAVVTLIYKKRKKL